jgi:Protein of unknown function (DUF3276)
VAYEKNEKKNLSVYSKRVRAGKRRTYFFDVKATRGNDYYITITESRRRAEDDNFDRHKVFVYKEDFNKFIKGLTEAVDYVKTDLMPDFDFDSFNHPPWSKLLIRFLQQKAPPNPLPLKLRRRPQPVGRPAVGIMVPMKK